MPIPSIYLEILDFYQIALNQLAPNVVRLLAGAIIAFEHLKLSLSPSIFHCLFQLKITEPDIFYFAGHPDY